MANVKEQNAIRIREKYRGANMYITIVFDEDGQPCDFHASISGEKINLDQNTLSNIDAIASMVSLSVREFDAIYVAGELLSVARGPNTLPSIFANILLEHCVKD